ncbi:hypothetical protein NPIL_669411, partial [Nephila pilipes]
KLLVLVAIKLLTKKTTLLNRRLDYTKRLTDIEIEHGTPADDPATLNLLEQRNVLEEEISRTT